jgi:hypothetical protein
MATDSIDPTALTPAQLAKVLSTVAKKPITEEQILDRLEAGAPISGGTIHLVHFTAWLVSLNMH